MACLYFKMSYTIYKTHGKAFLVFVLIKPNMLFLEESDLIEVRGSMNYATRKLKLSFFFHQCRLLHLFLCNNFARTFLFVINQLFNQDLVTDQKNEFKQEH